MMGRLGIRPNLGARLALVYGLTSLLVVSALGLSVYLWTARYLEQQARRELEALADFYGVYAASMLADQESLAILAPRIAGFFAPQADYDVRVFGARAGLLLGSSRDLGPLPSRTALAELDYRRATSLLASSQDEAGRAYAARTVQSADGTTLAVIEVSRRVADTQAFLSALRMILIAASGLAVIVALFASWILARQMTRPLREMELASQAIASGDLERRVSVSGQDEIASLAASINQMAADLARLESVRRDFVARVSHDLRTPLTAIKGLVINMQDAAPEHLQPSLEIVDEQSDRLARLVEDLLTASRLQRGELRLHRAPTDLGSIVRSAKALASGNAKRLGVTMLSDLPGQAGLVLGDSDRLQQVVLNLVDNALKATTAGGHIWIRMDAGVSSVTLTVSDDGRGLTAEEAERAFEPYFRGAGGGAGLGLTIAHDIVAAHNGRIWIRQRSEGGAEAGFSLPYWEGSTDGVTAEGD